MHLSVCRRARFSQFKSELLPRITVNNCEQPFACERNRLGDDMRENSEVPYDY